MIDSFMNWSGYVDTVIWHPIVLYIVLGVGVLFTIWTRFCQHRALTHGVAVTLGRYDEKGDPGAINHFQALSAALSATVGLGNIGGVAVAIALGGPGAVFWMWVVGLFGMAIKTTEVALSMLYRDTSDPDNPRGGPMWVARKAFAERGMGGVGTIVGGIFCVTLLTSAVTGGNMFQAWNVGEVSQAAGMPRQAAGILLAVMVGVVIIGGVKRIGAVAGRLVPFMCLLYLVAAFYVLLLNLPQIPGLLALIVQQAFSPTEAGGAFLGGTLGTAFAWGLKRALFSSEAGQGSSPIAHSAAKTGEPIREAVVGGLEPFIDTLVVCTLTALVILSSGVWNRPGEAHFAAPLTFVQVEEGWVPDSVELPNRTTASRRVMRREGWMVDENVFVLANVTAETGETAVRTQVTGEVIDTDTGLQIDWEPIEAAVAPEMIGTDLFQVFAGATLTTYAFDKVQPGMGTYLVLVASWLFAFSTMISWAYYGEQGIIYLFGRGAVLPYKFIYCGLAIVATAGFIQTDVELDRVTSLGTGVMLWANIPIMLIFGGIAMKAYHEYMRRLDAGEFHPHAAPPLEDVVEGRDVE